MRASYRAALAASAVVLLGAGCARSTTTEDWFGRTEPIESMDWDTFDEVEIAQDGNGAVYWVLPGKRALAPQEFGTPASPDLTAYVPPSVPEVQRDLVALVPYLVGVPQGGREVTSDGLRYTVTSFETPFGDEAVPVKGQFQLFARDRRRADKDEHPFDTPDEAVASVRFTDPDGGRYQIELNHVIEPPVPGWETGGGVLLGGYVGGDSGADSPLAPRAFAYAAVWGLADVKVNGKLVEQDKLVRIVTGETVRDRDYRLAQSWELPLEEERTVAGRPHHTSVLVYPVRMTPVGPVHEPLSVPYLTESAEPQPFIHVMFESDEIVKGPEFAVPNVGVANR